MDCQEVRNILSAYLDKVLEPQEEQRLVKHLETCSACQQELASLKTVINALGNSKEIFPPKGFGKDLRAKLEIIQADQQELFNKQELATKEKLDWAKSLGKFIRKPWVAAAMIVVLVLALPVMKMVTQSKDVSYVQDAAKNDAKIMAPEEGVAQQEAAVDADSAEMAKVQAEVPAITANEVKGDNASIAMDSAPKRSATGERKVIQEGYLQLEVKSIKAINEKIIGIVESKGGFVQNSSFNENNRGFASLVLRIPVKDYQTILESVEKLGKVKVKEIHGRDVTTEYLDLEARLKTLKAQEERLLALLEKGEELEDILKIEKELQRVREEIERQEGQLKALEDLAQLATLTIELYQDQLVPATSSSIEAPGLKGVLQRSLNALIDSSNNLIHLLGLSIVWLVGALPYLVLLGIAAGIYYWVRRRYFNKGW